MNHPKFVTAGFAALVALAVATSAFAEGGKRDSAAEIDTVLGAKTSPVQAITEAENSSGGRALKISLEKENGAFLYEIKTATKDKIAKVMIDPATGKTIRIDREGSLFRFFDRDDREGFKALAGVATTLAAAIAAAEQDIGGKAIEAKFDRDHDVDIFKIEVAKDHVIHRISVDAKTGAVLNVAAENDDEDDD